MVKSSKFWRAFVRSTQNRGSINSNVDWSCLVSLFATWNSTDKGLFTYDHFICPLATFSEHQRQGINTSWYISVQEPLISQVHWEVLLEGNRRCWTQTAGFRTTWGALAEIRLAHNALELRTRLPRAPAALHRVLASSSSSSATRGSQLLLSTSYSDASQNAAPAQKELWCKILVKMGWVIWGKHWPSGSA